jgi:hypothetical protein
MTSSPEAEVVRLRAEGVSFRNEIAPVELLQPAAARA